MQTEQQAFVLRSTDKGETSRLISLLTDQGRLEEIVLHGFKSRKSENKALFQPLNLLKITTETSRGKIKLLSTELSHSFPIIKGDLNKITFLSECCQILLKLPFDLQNDLKKHFQLQYTIQNELEANPVSDYKLLRLYYLYSLSYCFGIRPEEPEKSEIINRQQYFEPSTGGLYRERRSEQSVALSADSADLLKLLFYSRTADILQKAAVPENITVLQKILKRYFLLHLNYTPSQQQI